MKKLKKAMRVAMLYLSTLTVMGGYPLSMVMAQTPPASESTAPAQPIYTYNQETNRWDSDKWSYNPATKSYEKPVVVPAQQSPVSAPAATEATPPSAAPVAPTANMPEPTTSENTSAGQQQATASTNTIGTEHNSSAVTGNAGVKGNVAAGSATSGDAGGSTTIINAVHSVVQGDTSGVAHFTADIHGNVVGDITLSPIIKQLQAPPAASAVNSTANAIGNDVSISATSGNADVTGNTRAGDATSGNAHAMANVVNLINTIIAANQSFIGTINIYGNLDGDILISPEFIPQLIASNAAANPATSNSPVSLVGNDTQSIMNTIALSATSGQAEVSHNTNAGDATSGSAATNLTVLNLTGRQVSAANSMLVFVNVLGTWVGMIVDTPVGATAAALGSSVISSTTQSPMFASTSNLITNNIALSAQSGDAVVAGNTTAGDARSGNATASANVLNINMSSFSLTDWFGIVFINVLGSWYGSFGIDTQNGTMVALDVPAASSVPAATSTVAGSTPSISFGFRPKQALVMGSQYSGRAPSGATTQVLADAAVSRAELDDSAVVAGAATGGDGHLRATSAPRSDPFSLMLMIGGGVFVGFGALLELFRKRGVAALIA